MKNEKIDFLAKANMRIFPVLVVFAYLFIFLESYTYLGVLRKYVFVDSRFFLVLALVSATLLIGKKLNSLSVLTLKINTIVLILSTAVYLVMQFLESINFHNYVFSTYHIQPANLFYLIIASGALLLIHKFASYKKINFKFTLVNTILLITFLAIFVDGFSKTVNAAIYSNIYILTHQNSSYDFKMEERWGIYYDYIKFVKENTLENASILVPPQELPWYSTGNVGLDLYFLYPRRLSGGTLNKINNINKYDYVMLSWGEWNDAPKDKYGWPKEEINADKIIYFDPATKLVKEEAKDYNPKDATDGVWGLIKIKK